jgi:hypothetical protein
MNAFSFRSVNMGVTLAARRVGTKQARTAIADTGSATCRKHEGIPGLLLGTSRSQPLGEKNNGNERFTKLSQELREPLEAEHVVLSGGNAKKLKRLPANIISGSNQNAFLGGRGKRASVEVMELGFAETQYQEVFRQPPCGALG